MNMRASYCLLLVCFVLQSGLARSESRQEVDLPAVLVTGVKDPDAFQVARGANLMHIFRQIPEVDRDKIRLAFYVTSRDGGDLPADLKIGLIKGDDETPLVLLPSGELQLPLLDQEQASGAEVVTNVRRGRLKVVYFVQPIIGEQTTIGHLRQAMLQARSAWRKLYGSLVGWTVPAFSCVNGFYSSPSVISIRTSGAGAKVVWQSESKTKVTLQLNEQAFQNDFVVDWGSPPPWRVGGCVSTERESANG